MSYDPQYVERVVSYLGPVDSRPERTAPAIDPDFSSGFLLGKGLTPQEVFDVATCWWHEGYEFAKKR